MQRWSPSSTARPTLTMKPALARPLSPTLWARPRTRLNTEDEDETEDPPQGGSHLSQRTEPRHRPGGRQSSRWLRTETVDFDRRATRRNDLTLGQGTGARRPD